MEKKGKNLRRAIFIFINIVAIAIIPSAFNWAIGMKTLYMQVVEILFKINHGVSLQQACLEANDWFAKIRTFGTVIYAIFLAINVINLKVIVIAYLEDL